MRKYYEAYDDRYRQVHGKMLQWASSAPSAIVEQVLERYGVPRDGSILELGCGEGRDAVPMLRKGYDLTAMDISPEAIRYCRAGNPEFAECFQILDCVAEEWSETYDFIYAVAVIHMLVEDSHRAAFYRFIRDHLTDHGIGLVCTMGDGTVAFQSDVSTAFDLQERTHEATGDSLLLAGTSCRMVTREEFLGEIRTAGLEVIAHGLTEVPPDFPVMMYAVVKK